MGKEKATELDTMYVRAHTLIEALPYIQQFHKKIIVIKYGGSAMVDDDLRLMIMKDIALLKYVGILPVIVHGGGPAINQMLNRVGVESTFHSGMRITDEKTLEITEMVLAGKVNKELVRLLQLQGVNAVGITGKDGNLFTARRRTDTEIDLGLVGEIYKVDPRLLFSLFDSGFVPVVAPISMDTQGVTYNINADEAAVAVASSLEAEKLIFLTDVPGILRTVGDTESRISHLTADEAEELLMDGTVSGGMMPKLRCAVQAVRGNTSAVHIIDGEQSHALLLEILTAEGVGTLISRKNP
ncbi:MAG: acetylglutamate kinase [Spirochaetota bacterium]|nr:acetylglutamate kinase [Spirochaetota bacterium]